MLYRERRAVTTVRFEETLADRLWDKIRSGWFHGYIRTPISREAHDHYVGYVKLMGRVRSRRFSSRGKSSGNARRTPVRGMERLTRLMLVICLIGWLRRGKWKHCALTTSSCGNKPRARSGRSIEMYWDRRGWSPQASFSWRAQEGLAPIRK